MHPAPRQATAPQSDEQKRATWQQQAINRLGPPADITGAVLFLASDDAAFIPGQAIVVCEYRSKQETFHDSPEGNWAVVEHLPAFHVTLRIGRYVAAGGIILWLRQNAEPTIART